MWSYIAVLASLAVPSLSEVINAIAIRNTWQHRHISDCGEAIEAARLTIQEERVSV
jgi:hypothetical protein